MSNKDSEILISAKINYNIPENLVRRYATNLTIQTGENEYILSFFEAYPPILVGDREDVAEKAKSIKSIQANCVSSIVISPQKMGEFIKTLQKVYSAHAERLPAKS